MTNKSGPFFNTVSNWFSYTGIDPEKMELNAAPSLAAKSHSPEPYLLAPERGDAKDFMKGVLAARQEALSL